METIHWMSQLFRALSVNPVGALPEFQRNNFGGSFGGPIKKTRHSSMLFMRGCDRIRGRRIAPSFSPEDLYRFGSNLNYLRCLPCPDTARNPAIWLYRQSPGASKGS